MVPAKAARRGYRSPLVATVRSLGQSQRATCVGKERIARPRERPLPGGRRAGLADMACSRSTAATIGETRVGPLPV
jgi:hypothetical protein